MGNFSKSLFNCDRCGFSYKRSEAKKELSGLYVCRDCYDGQYQLLNHPQNKPPTDLGPDSVLPWVRSEPPLDVPVQLSAVDIFKQSNAFCYVYVPTSSSSGPG